MNGVPGIAIRKPRCEKIKQSINIKQNIFFTT